MSPQYEPIDYSRRLHERRKMTNYLRTGSFKKISGSPIYGKNALRRRVWLSAFAILVILVGLYFVFF